MRYPRRRFLNRGQIRLTDALVLLLLTVVPSCAGFQSNIGGRSFRRRHAFQSRASRFGFLQSSSSSTRISRRPLEQSLHSSAQSTKPCQRHLVSLYSTVVGEIESSSPNGVHNETERMPRTNELSQSSEDISAEEIVTIPTAAVPSSPQSIEDPRPTERQHQRRAAGLDMPWSDIQANALRDKVSRFTVQVPIATASTNDHSDNVRCVVLWRNLVYDTPELAGYPIPVLIQHMREIDARNEFPFHVDYEQILPFLDEYEFESSGGLAANLYGVSGIADRTRIRTSPVVDVHVTLPHNFVRTADGTVLYELGRPQQPDTQQIKRSEDYSLNGTTKNWQRNGKEIAASMWGTKADTSAMSQENNGIDPDLLQLGGLTALVVGGALAMESLSHHLTVNVFWV